MKNELEKYKSTWLTELAYKILREEKKKQGKSMMRIIQDILIEKYVSSKN